MTTHDLETLFIVLQTFWDIFLLSGFALIVSVVIAYLANFTSMERQ